MNNQSAKFGAPYHINGRQTENVDLWLYERGIAATSCGVTITDATQAHNPIIYCNPAFESITGFQPEEVLGRNCKFLQGKDTDPAVVEQIRQALRTKQECQVVLKNYRKDGTPFWNELKISPVCDRNGCLTNFIGVQTDITSRIESEAALKASEMRLRLALNAAKMGVWDWDVDTGKVTWSEEVESIFGLDAGCFGGTYEAYLNCIHPEDCYSVTQQMSHLAEVGGDFRIEHRILLPDGSVRWVVNKGAVLCDVIGASVRMTGTLMDISERKQAELALRQQLEIERLLNGIAQRIRQSLKLEEVLNTAVAEVRQFLKTDRVVLYRLEPDGSGVVVVESIAANWMPILGKNIQDPCFASKHFHHYRQGRIRAIDDLKTANIQKCHIKLLESFQVKANLVVPVLQGEKLWGLLIAHHCREPRKWTEAEIDLLKQLSVQLAIALQQSELYQQVQTELAERKQAEAALRQSEDNLKEQAMQLRLALNDLQSAQSQLIQSEKMSSLGQLVAGVAHEINNPVNFISGNIDHASQYIQDLLNLVQLYQKNYPNPSDEIQDETEAIDLEFVVEDLPKMLDSMKMGTSRIREIVLSLRNFSRHDEAEKKPVDIHEGIDNTLLILQHRLKPNGDNPGVQVIKKYTNLPQVDCYAGQLNQVFMNIISNAIDALEEQLSPRIITISTELVTKSDLEVWSCELPSNLGENLLASNSYKNKNSQGVLIRISDNGSGIPESVKKRIFDPFFTTKPVGKGTGMGLSISYQVVVERHRGQLTCLSNSMGTEFLIVIPLENIEKKNGKAVAVDLALTSNVGDQTPILQLCE